VHLNVEAYIQLFRIDPTMVCIPDSYRYRSSQKNQQMYFTDIFSQFFLYTSGAVSIGN